MNNRMANEWDARAIDNAFYYIDTDKVEHDEHLFFLKGERLAYELVNPFLAENHVNPADKRMLDIGCGVGRLEQGFKNMFSEVWGTDVSREMILRAQEINRSDNVHFSRCNGHDLCDFSDESFDFVFSYITFQHIPDKQITIGYLNEIFRLLKPGGLFKFSLARHHSWIMAFKFVPFPTLFTPYLPMRARKLYWKMAGKDKGSLARGATWDGTSFKEHELNKILVRTGFSGIHIFQDQSRADTFWCCGNKPDSRINGPCI